MLSGTEKSEPSSSQTEYTVQYKGGKVFSSPEEEKEVAQLIKRHLAVTVDCGKIWAFYCRDIISHYQV